MPRTPGATVAGSIAAMREADPAGRARAAYELCRLIEEPPHSALAVTRSVRQPSTPDPLVRRIAAAMLGRLVPTAPAAGPPRSRAAGDSDHRSAGWRRGGSAESATDWTKRTDRKDTHGNGSEITSRICLALGAGHQTPPFARPKVSGRRLGSESSPQARRLCPPLRRPRPTRRRATAKDRERRNPLAHSKFLCAIL